ncbi:MAG: DDE-type integrase/transposase/recombinase [Caulobacter sp.]|nr:DDE-type integrase/transposase/recombinase [Caulobacter sp.]
MSEGCCQSNTNPSPLRPGRPRPTGHWRLDEMVVKIGGKRMFLWRAVDDEGEVLDMPVQERRNKSAAHRQLRTFLKNQGVHPEAIVTGKRASYRAAARDLGLQDRHRPGWMRGNNRAENSHLLIRPPALRLFPAEAHRAWAAATAAA